MANLLAVSRLQAKVRRYQGKPLFALEFPVPAETAPYLVTGSSSLLWVAQAKLPGPNPENPCVRAAVRACTADEVFQEVIDVVASMGLEAQWGNVHPLTEEGLLQAVAHLDYYDLGPVELLTPRVYPKGSTTPKDDADDEDNEGDVELMPPELRPLIEATGLPFRPSSWVPLGTIVVVPRDRAYVGVLEQVTARKVAAVVHNPSRGIAIVRGGLAQATP